MTLQSRAMCMYVPHVQRTLCPTNTSVRTAFFGDLPSPPPLAISRPPCNPPSPTHARPSLHCFARQYLLWSSVPTCHTRFLALLSHHFKSVTCVYSVIFSLQRRCTGCCVAFPDCDTDRRYFLPVTVYGTTHAHLVHMCWPLLWGLHQMGRSFATIGTYGLVGSLKWIMWVLHSQGSIWWRTVLYHQICPSRRCLSRIRLPLLPVRRRAPSPGSMCNFSA